jgi:hypothetical protein
MATTTINVTNQLQDLQSVTDEGNITTNDINLDNSSLILDNGSKLTKGWIDNGADGGIARECAVNYQDQWENGIQYFINQGGYIVRANSINGTTPGVNHDITMGYIVGSIFHDMNNQTKYQCTDNTDGAAVWVSFFETPQPTTNYGLFAQTANSTTITNTTTESTLIGTGVGSLSIPANAFEIGDSFHAKLIGHISCNNSATIHLRVKSGSVLLADTGVIALDTTTNKHWEINVYFTIRALGAAGVASIASGGIFSYIKNSGLNFEGNNFSIVNDTTFDTTINNTLNITAQWGAANAANSIYSEIFTLNKTY